MKQKNHNYFTVAGNPSSAIPEITSMAGGGVKPISQQNPKNEMKIEGKISISQQNFVSVYLHLDLGTSTAKYTTVSSSWNLQSIFLINFWSGRVERLKSSFEPNSIRRGNSMGEVEI